MRIDYKNLIFANEQYDISQVQTTVGITIEVGAAKILWANTAGDLGGEPESLDCTPLSATVQMNKTGIQSLDNWTVDYFYNSVDFKMLETQKKAGTIVDIIITLPSGEKFKNRGKCTANYATGIAVNGMLSGHAVFELSNTDGWVHEDASSS